MGGGGTSKSSNGNAPKARKRVQVDSSSSSSSSALKRAHDGSAFTRCDECNRQVPVALIGWHDCFVEAKIDKSLDAQMAEYERPSDPERSKVKSTEPKAKKVKKEKKAKDPNAPKRPPTAFFIFMDEFRKSYKEANPDCKSVSVVAKEGGEKWKSMTEEEKKPFLDRAAELKTEYGKALKSANGAQNAEDGGDSLDKEAAELVPDDDE